MSRLSPGRFEHLEVVGEPELAIFRLIEDGEIRQLRGEEQPVGAGCERSGGDVARHLRDPTQTGAQLGRVSPQVLDRQSAGELIGDRQRAEDGLQQHHVGIERRPGLGDGVEHHPVESLPNVKGRQRRPVRRAGDREAGGLPGAAGGSPIVADRAPVDRRVVAGRHQLDQVEAVRPLPPQRRRGQTLRGLVFLREMAPKRHRRSIDGFAGKRRADPFARTHLGGVRHRRFLCVQCRPALGFPGAGAP